MSNQNKKPDNFFSELPGWLQAVIIGGGLVIGGKIIQAGLNEIDEDAKYVYYKRQRDWHDGLRAIEGVINSKYHSDDRLWDLFVTKYRQQAKSDRHLDEFLAYATRHRNEVISR